METYTEPRDLVPNPGFAQQKRATLSDLREGMVEAPLIGLVRDFNALPHAFTLQCCYGHFLHPGQRDEHNLEPLPATEAIAQVEYRIAYLAFCVAGDARGERLLSALGELAAGDPDYLQLCSAEWFWERQVNSYALQVEPERFKRQDRAVLDYRTALRVQEARDAFFPELQAVIDRMA